jgi:hypothetical protein
LEKYKTRFAYSYIFNNCYVINLKNIQVCALENLTKKSYIEFKKKIFKLIKEINREQFQMIGGRNLVVQADETVIVRGRLIMNPSNQQDDLPG